MAKRVKILAVIILIICLASLLCACELKYGTPDSLNMAGASVGQRIWIGLQVALLGIGTVFIVLFLLILFINLLEKFFKIIGNIKKPIKEEVKDKIEVKDEILEDLSNDEEVVAAITAALMAYYTSQPNYKSNVKFKVRSIKEIK